MPATVVTQPDAVTDPVFAEPWQAQAFALTMQLSQRGAFTWGDWVEVFSTEIRTHPAQPGEDSTDAYYRQWLAALETILTARGLSTPEEITRMQDLWRQAYLHTPHGLPIALENARDSARDNARASAPEESARANTGLGHDADADHHHDHDDDHGDHHHHHHHHHHHVAGVRQPVAVSPAVRPS